jgi:hypothetical protein
MDHRTFWCGGFASFVAVSACSPSPGDAPPPIDAGDDGPSDYPPLPDDCDVTLPVLSTGSGLKPTGRTRIRIVEGTVYAPGDDGINAIPVSGGAPATVMPYPTFPIRSDAALARAPLHDFWIERESIVGVLAGALVTAPLTGGPPALVPGYSWPAAEEALFETESYVRAGSYVYATSQLSTGGRGIRRHALAGGAPSDFLTFNSSTNRPFLVTCGDSLYYVDGDAPGSSQPVIFATPSHEAKPSLVPAEFRAASVAGCDGNLYVLEGADLPILWRGTEDGRWTRLKLPFHAAMWTFSDVHYASYRGASYFTGFALYRLRDDRRTGRRDVVFRARADSDTVEIARCLPEAAIDPTSPRSDLSTNILGLAVDGDALYAVASTNDSQKRSWKDHLVQVPP